MLGIRGLNLGGGYVERVKSRISKSFLYPVSRELTFKRGEMKKVYLVALAIVLVAGLILAGCSSPASPPAPTPAPAPAPAPPTIPKPYEVTFGVLSATSSTYAIGVVLAEQVNDQSEWLRATCPEGINATVTLKQMVEDSALRTQQFFFASESTIYFCNQHTGPTGEPPFNTFDYSEFMPMFFWGVAGKVLVTIDPKLKTLEDLEGKRVIVDDVKGGETAYLLEAVFKEAGVNAKYEYIKGSAAIEAMKDGLVDAWVGGLEPQMGGEWKAGRGLPDLIATEDVYYIQMDPAITESALNKLGFPGFVLTVPAGKMGATQPEPVYVLANSMWWGAHQSMPDEVVTELMQVVYDNCETWKDYKADRAVMTKQTLGSIGVPESRYHPAALAFLKDKGIPITTFGK